MLIYCLVGCFWTHSQSRYCTSPIISQSITLILMFVIKARLSLLQCGDFKFKYSRLFKMIFNCNLYVLVYVNAHSLL